MLDAGSIAALKSRRTQCSSPPALRGVMAVLLGLVASGCAHGGPPIRGDQDICVGAVGIPELDPLRQSINTVDGTRPTVAEAASPAEPLQERKASRLRFPRFLLARHNNPGSSDQAPARDIPQPTQAQSPVAPGPTKPPVDSEVRQTQQTPTPTPSMAPLAPLDPNTKLVGLTVAVVGGEPITLRELQSSVQDWQRENLPAGRQLSREELNSVASGILSHLVERTLIVQEARRTLLDTDKKFEMFIQFIDQQWQEQELPKLLRKHKVKDDIELAKVFEAQGRSLTYLKQNFRFEALSQEFLRQSLKSRLARPELPAMWEYYREHLAEFDRPAQVTWREIMVHVESSDERPAALEKAKVLWNSLTRGEDFQTLARSSSEGPTASKGGLWQTEPGASVAPAVNKAIETLPLGQISTVLEGPGGFHIVRVEERRQAGPAPFTEAQDRILAVLQEKQFKDETNRFLEELRARTVIVSRFQLPAEK